MAFRLSTKNFFLTYPSLSREQDDKDGLLSFLSENFEQFEPSYICVARELHEDGTPHLHAVVVCTRRRDIRNAHILDFRGKHGNYKQCRDLSASVTYIQKDGDFVEEGERPSGRTKRSYSSLVACTTAEQFWELASTEFSRDYIINHERLEYVANKLFKPSLPEYTPSFTFSSIPPIVDQWLQQIDDVRPKSLIIWGPSRTGKTELARSLGQHIYFNGLFNIDDFNENAKYAIFDDWEDWCKLYQWKQWIGAQQYFAVTDKYRKKRTIKWGKPCIILSNVDPVFPDMPWLQLNTFKLHVGGRLY